MNAGNVARLWRASVVAAVTLGLGAGFAATTWAAAAAAPSHAELRASNEAGPTEHVDTSDTGDYATPPG